MIEYSVHLNSIYFLVSLFIVSKHSLFLFSFLFNFMFVFVFFQSLSSLFPLHIYFMRVTSTKRKKKSSGIDYYVIMVSLVFCLTKSFVGVEFDVSLYWLIHSHNIMSHELLGFFLFYFDTLNPNTLYAFYCSFIFHTCHQTRIAFNF